MKSLALAVLFAPTIALAEPRWRLDLSARGIGSVELDPNAAMMRGGVVPAVGARFARKLGRLHVGAMIGAGFPAWYGKTEGALSIDYDHMIADRTCTIVDDDFIGTQRCRGARWLLALGVDAGVGMLYFDAPPEAPASGDALMYWGPLVRARVQVHILDVLPSAKAVGLVIAANGAVTSARYMSPGTGTGVRVEPELELGITSRF